MINENRDNSLVSTFEPFVDGQGRSTAAWVFIRRMRHALATTDVRAAALAGLAGDVAYTVAMLADLRLCHDNVDDFILLGWPVVGAHKELARPVGALMHTANGVVLAILYAAVAADRLPGPPWLRGALFANIENSTLYPLALLQSYHPAIRSGHLDPYWTWKAYLQSIPRHIAYGAAVGAVYHHLRRR